MREFTNVTKKNKWYFFKLEAYGPETGFVNLTWAVKLWPNPSAHMAFFKICAHIMLVHRLVNGSIHHLRELKFIFEDKVDKRILI